MISGFERNIKKYQEEGMEKALEEGLEKGKKKSAIEIAKRMLVKGMAIKEVADITDLSVKELDEIAKEIS